MKQKHTATCFPNGHEIQQLATTCRYHTPNKPSNDLTILACYNCDLNFPRKNGQPVKGNL